VRVHELAKELGVPSKDILAALEEMGLGGRTASSAVPEEAIPRLRASGGKTVPGAKPKAATVAPLPERRPEKPAEPEGVGAAPAESGDGKVPDAGVMEPAADVAPPSEPAPAETLPTIRVSRGASAQDIAEKTGRTPAEVVKKLFDLGEMVTATQSLTDETIEVLVRELGAQAEIVGLEEAEEAEEEPVDESRLRPRPLSRYASRMVPRAGPWGSAFSSWTSAVSRSVSSRLSSPARVFADTSMNS